MAGDFRVEEDGMNQLLDIFTQMNIELSDAHDMFSALLSLIESGESWKGESKKSFIAYMKLLEQYHRALASVGVAQPISEAREALSEYRINTDTFYADFTEYKKLQTD